MVIPIPVHSQRKGKRKRKKEMEKKKERKKEKKENEKKRKEEVHQCARPMILSQGIMKLPKFQIALSYHGHKRQK